MRGRVRSGWHLVALSNQTAPMSIAITEDHRALAETVAGFLAKHSPRPRPGPCWRRRASRCPRSGTSSPSLGWLGPARPRGARRLGVRAGGARRRGRGARPGRRARARSCPTVIASAVLAAAGRRRRRRSAAARPGRRLDDRRGRARRRRRASATARRHGDAGVVLGGGLADVLLVAAGDDVAVVDASADGVTVETPAEPRPDPPRGPRHARRRAGRRCSPGARQALRRPRPR